MTDLVLRQEALESNLEIRKREGFFDFAFAFNFIFKFLRQGCRAQFGLCLVCSPCLFQLGYDCLPLGLQVCAAMLDLLDLL